MEKKVTIKDIAKLANTSIATVSRVINKTNYPVKEELRKRVLKASKELNYYPNLLGKHLKTNKSNEIGVIIPNISNLYYNLLISGIEHVVRDSGYYILLCNTNGNPELEKRYLENLYQKQVKGMIISSVNPDTSYLDFLQKSNVQIVAFEQDIDLNCNKINFDYFRGGYIAAEHLIKKGHRTIGFISAPLTRHSRKKVYNGFKFCLQEHGIEEDKTFIEISPYDEKDKKSQVSEYQNGKILASKLISKRKLPTGVFCINDMTAFGAIHHFQNNGLKIPDDISIMGFDNIDIAEMVTPPLTTIDQSTFEMGRLAAEELLYSLENESRTYTNSLLQPTLIERNSTTVLKNKK